MRPLLLVLLSCLAVIPAFGASPYVRLGTGFAHGLETVVRDRDCSATAPPALFGCVSGNDGTALGARGDFGRTPVLDAAAGIEVTPSTRVELALTHGEDFELDAAANFIGVAGLQPVDAHVRSTSAFVVASRDLGAHFFVSAGAGVARNAIGASSYRFPAIAADAVTIMPGGTNVGFAWMAAAGITFPLSDRFALDVGVRYADLGEVRTDDGQATIIRPNRHLTLDIAGTESELQTSGVSVSLRWRL